MKIEIYDLIEQINSFIESENAKGYKLRLRDQDSYLDILDSDDNILFYFSKESVETLFPHSFGYKSHCFKNVNFHNSVLKAFSDRVIYSASTGSWTVNHISHIKPNEN